MHQRRLPAEQRISRVADGFASILDALANDLTEDGARRITADSA